jgi:hypothetical protein
MYIRNNRTSSNLTRQRFKHPDRSIVLAAARSAKRTLVYRMYNQQDIVARSVLSTSGSYTAGDNLLAICNRIHGKDGSIRSEMTQKAGCNRISRIVSHTDQFIRPCCLRCIICNLRVYNCRHQSRYRFGVDSLLGVS